MALASALHLSAHKTRAQHNAQRGQKNAGTEYYELSDEDAVPARGSRPPCLGEPRGPQERDLPRTVEQIAVCAPMVQILDAPVPQLVEHLPDVWRFFDLLLPVPEQVIEVPKILLDDVPARTVVRDTQLVEQLVEVPTIVSFSSLQQRTGSRFLTFLFPVVEVVVDGEVFKVFSQDRIQQRSLRRSLTFQFLVIKTSSFLFPVVEVVVVGEVFTVFSQDRIQQRTLRGSLTFQFLVIKTSSLDRVQHLLLQHISQRCSSLHPRRWRLAVLQDLVVVFKTLSQDRVQQRFSEMEDLVVVFKTLSQDRVQMMMTSFSVAPTSSWSMVAASTGITLRRKRWRWRRRRRRRRRSRWTLRSSPRASKAISAPGASVPSSSVVVTAGGVRRALSRTRMTSSTQTCRDYCDGCPCDHAASVPAVRPLLSCRAVLPDIMVGLGSVSAHLWQFHSCSSWTKWFTFLSWRRCRFPVLTVQNYRDFSLQYIDQVIGVGFASRAVPRSVLEETVVLFFVVDVPVVPDCWHSSLTLWTSL